MMLPSVTKLARLLVTRRILLKLSQRQVAAGLGCSQPYLAQVETGHRPISKQMATRLESLFKVKPGRFTGGVFPKRGRPVLEAEAQRALQQIAGACGEAPRPLEPLGVPRYPRGDFASGLANPLWPIAVHLGLESQQEVSRLEELRCSDERFWRQLNAVRYDSWSEKRLHVRIGLEGAPLTGVCLSRLGCELPGLNGKSGRASGRRAYPAFVWQREELSIALFPQRCVGTRRTHRWPDNLIVAARDGRKITGIVEVDGEDYHSDPETERLRDLELDVPVLHLGADEVGEPDVITKIEGWLRTLL